MPDDYDVRLAIALEKGLSDAFSKVSSRKARLRTEATFSGLLNGYREANPGANKLEAHADGGHNIHLQEEHSEYIVCEPFGRKKGMFDLSVRGGEKDMQVESEYGGARRREEDVDKVCECHKDDSAVFVYRATSFNQCGRNDDDYRKKTEDGRTLTIAEVYQRDKDPLNHASVTVKTFRDGREIYRTGSTPDPEDRG